MYEPIPMKRNMKYGSSYWEGYSPKAKRVVHLFSDLEYDNWVLIETNPNIVSYCEQPVRVKQWYEGEIAESIIDMWVEYKDGKESFIEVKYLKELDLNNPKSRRSLRQVSVQNAWCQENGFNYIIQTEKEIRENQIYLENMKHIISFVRNIGDINELDKFRIMELIKNGTDKLVDIEKHLSNISASRIRESLFYMIYKGEVIANVDAAPIGYKTEVGLPIEPKNN